jgi:hypothetical protein
MVEDYSEEYKSLPRIVDLTEEDRLVVEEMAKVKYPDLAAYQGPAEISREYMKLFERKASGREAKEKIIELAEKASLRVLFCEVMIAGDDYCLKVLRKRYSQERFASLAECIYAWTLLFNNGMRSSKVLNEFKPYIFDQIEGLAAEAKEEEIIQVLKDCLYICSRDLAWTMLYILKCSERPWKIAEQIKDYHVGFTGFSTVLAWLEDECPRDS